jgi:hypothetical protein
MSIGDADADAAEQHVFKFQSRKGTRGIFNRIVFANAFAASPKATIITFSEDIMMMDSPIAVAQQRAVLKILSKNFQREIKAIYDEEGSFDSQLCKNPRHLTDNDKKMVFGVYRAALPHYIYTNVRAVQDARWKLFFTQHILGFHNHVSECGERKSMSLDGTLLLNDVTFNKSDFDRIPVVVHSRRKDLQQQAACKEGKG